MPAYLNSTNIDNLLPNTKYMLKVSAITDENANGYESQEVIFVTPVTSKHIKSIKKILNTLIFF